MKRTLLTAVLIASGATLLIAAGPKADLNQDGQVTKAEFTESAQARFYAADTNNDGFLSQEERSTQMTVKREAFKDKRFTQRDKNGDGLLSRDEISTADAKRRDHHDARRQKMMEKYDTNVDGSLSDAERVVMQAERKEKMAEMKGKHAESRGKRPTQDANADGLISLDEHMAIAEKLFTRMDANADGVLTQGEGKSRKDKYKRIKNRGR